MEQVHVRKRKDSTWRVRELLTVPDWAVVEFCADGKPRTAKQIYSALGRSLTRKTLIRSLRTLSVELKVLEPQHVQTKKGYAVGFSLSPHVRDAMPFLRKLNVQLEKR